MIRIRAPRADATIHVRAARGDDAEAIRDIYAPYVATGAASFETEPPTLADMRARIAGDDGLYPWLVAQDRDGGAILGYAYAGAFRQRAGYRWTVETGVYVADGRQGGGFGRRLYAALLATLTAQGFAQAAASITLPNPASIALHQAAGFRPAGVFRGVGYKGGEWRDVGIWQRELAGAGDPPAEPRRFADVGSVQAG